MNPSKSTVVARLALEDGTVFQGLGFGACEQPRSQTGEVVFNTAMCGYQEALTDPSYAGQILTMTASMMGNYGVADQDTESGKPQVAGFVIRELSRIPSNYRSTEHLSTWLRSAGVIGIHRIDTRSLVRHLRTRGAMRGVITCDSSKTNEELVRMALEAPSMSGQNLACAVAPADESVWSDDLGEWRPLILRPRDSSGSTYRVVALDCGAKRNIYRNLTDRGCEVLVVPYRTSAARIRELNPDGLFISNGPGDPEAVDAVVETLRQLVNEIPTFGICLGHQLLARAFGGKTYKLKFGHRGANQPVRNLITGRIEITSQNHGFCVDPDSLDDSTFEMTHVHLNDQTLAGFRHRTRPVFSVQYHPEASPGPHDSSYLFDCFIEMMRTTRPVDTARMAELQYA